MASYTTAIEEFSQNGNSVTYAITSTHTANAPRLVIQRRRVANGNKQHYEMDLDVVHGLLDSAGVPVTAKLVLSANARIPTVATSAEIDAALADFRDFIDSDEFTATVKKQLFVG